MAIIDFLKSATKVYDPSLHELSIAGLVIDAVTQIRVVTPPITKTMGGTHPIYSMVVKSTTSPANVTFDILPTSLAVDKLFALSAYLEQYGGFFDVVVKRSGSIILQGSGYFESNPNELLNMEGNELTFVLMVNQYNSSSQTIQSLGPNSLEAFLQN